MRLKPLVRQRAESLVIASLVLVTVSVNPFTNFDPINPIKQFILATTAFGLLGLIWKSLYSGFSKPLRVIATIYLFAMILPLFLADSPIPQQLWGTFGRNTGFLTYVSSAFLIFGTAAISSASFMQKIFKAGMATITFLAVYGLAQSNDLDPISWSAQDVFGTLGNVNFLSALLGFTSVALFTITFYSHQSLKSRFWLLTLLTLSIYIVVKTDSVQGLIVFLAGTYVTTLLFLYKQPKIFFKALTALLTTLGLVIAYFGFRGLAGNGPLGSLLYQNTNVFRADYMGAAWRTFMNHFFFGVGFDGFDGWYRTDRGFISAYRTGTARTTNSAHNVILDVANNGGVLLVASYLALLFAALLISVRRIHKNPFDAKFLGLFGAWIAYVLQSTISINQIGVSIWGWVTTGILLGSAKWDEETDTDVRSAGATLQKAQIKKIKNHAKKSNQMLPAGIAIRAIAIASLGTVLGFIPLKADADFQQARKQANLNEMMAASKNIGATAFHLSMTLDSALKSNYPDQAKEISDELILRFPREFYGWQVRLQIQGLTQSERDLAVSKLTEIDPFFACALSNPSGRIRAWLDELPLEKKTELLRWWGVIPFEQKSLSSDSVSLAQFEEAIQAKAASFCGR
jgi:O-antigen ligase